MRSRKGVSKRTSSGLPAKQKLIIELRPKIKYVIKEFPYITYCIDSRELAKNLQDVIEKLGFICNQIPSRDKKYLIQNLIYAFKKDHLILFHYRKKIDGSTILDVLRELREEEPYQSFKSIIPIFLASPNSKVQRELFQLLSRFDIRHAIFLPINKSILISVGAVLKEIIKYRDSMMEGAVFEPSEKPVLSAKEKEEAEIIASYKALISRAEDMMRSNPRKAIALFTEAIELKPNFNILMERGDAYFKIEGYLQAFNDYKEANKLKDDEPDPHAKMSSCCFAMAKDMVKAGQRDKAKRWFNYGFQSLVTARTMIEKSSKEFVVTPGGALTNQLKHVMSALSEADFRDIGMDNENKMVAGLMSKVFHMTRAIDFSHPGIDIDAQIDHAILLTRGKHYEQAEKMFENIINADPKAGGPAFNNFAVELRKNGEYGKAFKAYAEVLKYEIPDRDIVLLNLTMAGRKYALELRNTSQMDKAVTVYKQILESSYSGEGREWVLLDLAITFIEMEDQPQAALRLMEAIYINRNIMNLKEFEPYKELQTLKRDIVSRLTKEK